MDIIYEPSLTERSPNIDADASPKSWATQSDWVRYESLVKQLYEKYPLLTVMDKMEEEEGFNATCARN